MTKISENCKPRSAWPRVILVEPGDARNIGAVARAMSNFGFEQLCIVGERPFDTQLAQSVACDGAALITLTQRAHSLEQALESARDVVAFSARTKERLVQGVSFAEWLSRSPDISHTALLFGPEQTGFRNEHLMHVRTLVTIETPGSNTSLNLAQAVVLVLYEVSALLFQRAPTAVQTEARAQWQGFNQLDRLLDDVMQKSEFLGASCSPEIAPLVKNLFRRIHPSEREMNMLLGLFSRISKTIHAKKERTSH